MESTSVASSPTNPYGRSQPIIVRSSMSSTEIASALKEHGCVDLTEQLDLGSCSMFAVTNGGSGDVFSGQLQNGTHVAIKVFRLHIVRSQSGKHLKHAAKELHTWSKCQHPNVLRLLGLVEFRGQIGMVSPWIERGNLRAYIDQEPTVDRYQLCFNICDGLAYLHGIKIIHGDLKGANVLISEDGTPLLTDFGNSILGDQSLLFTKSATNSTFSPRWTAPEVLDGLVSSSYAADVFSLGMTLLETITGQVPYHELKRDVAVITAISSRKVPPTRSELHFPTDSPREDTMWYLLTDCWRYEPRERPKVAWVRKTVEGIWKRTIEFRRNHFDQAVEAIRAYNEFRRESGMPLTTGGPSDTRRVPRPGIRPPANKPRVYGANQTTSLTSSDSRSAYDLHYHPGSLNSGIVRDNPSEPEELASSMTETNQGEGSSVWSAVSYGPTGGMEGPYDPSWLYTSSSTPFRDHPRLGYPFSLQNAPPMWGYPEARFPNSGVGDDRGWRTHGGSVTSSTSWHTAREGTSTPPDQRIPCD